MPMTPQSSLFIVAGPLTPDDVRSANSHFAGQTIHFLRVDSSQDADALPADWGSLALTDLGTLEELRLEYLANLEQVAATPIDGNHSLNQILHRRDGYSFWWTDVGVRRSPTHGMFLTVKAIWLIARAVEKIRPGRVLVQAPVGRLAANLFAAIRGVADVQFSPSSARPAEFQRFLRWPWLKHSLKYVRKLLVHRVRRFRLIARTHVPPERERRPTVVLSGLFPRHVSNGRVWYWDDLSAALSARKNPPVVRHLLDLDSADTLPLDRDFTYFTKDADRLAGVPDVAILWRGHLKPSVWLGTIWHHVRQLARFYRLLGRGQFRDACSFRGVDLSPEWIAEIQHSLTVAIWWESEVDAAESTLRQIGNVRVALVHQEFEPRGMILIAACRRLGIPTVGVQHGTFYPLHTIYTPPAAQVRSTPTPDYFAVYGDYTKEVVSEYGAYPADRVWTCAGSRFDGLAIKPPDRTTSRERLGLPIDAFVILVTTQNYAWFQLAVRSILAGALEGSIVCVKSFRGDVDVYQKIVDESGRSNSRLFVDRFEELLGACDVLISGSSTTLLEATLADKPTVCLNLSTEPFYYPYVDEGVSIGVREPGELPGVLQRLQSFVPDADWQARRRRFLERHLGPAAHGEAAAEFARRVHELARVNR